MLSEIKVTRQQQVEVKKLVILDPIRIHRQIAMPWGHLKHKQTIPSYEGHNVKRLKKKIHTLHSNNIEAMAMPLNE